MPGQFSIVACPIGSVAANIWHDSHPLKYQTQSVRHPQSAESPKNSPQSLRHPPPESVGNCSPGLQTRGFSPPLENLAVRTISRHAVFRRFVARAFTGCAKTKKVVILSEAKNPSRSKRRFPPFPQTV